MAKKLTAAEIDALQASWAWKVARPLHKVEREIQRWRRRWGKRQEAGVSLAAPAPDFTALEAAYHTLPMASEPDTFVLYRILGNDLEPRHRKGQTRSSLGLILAHEPALEGCEKRWILNRIVDRDEECRLIDLLERSGQS